MRSGNIWCVIKWNGMISLLILNIVKLSEGFCSGGLCIGSRSSTASPSVCPSFDSKSYTNIGRIKINAATALFAVKKNSKAGGNNKKKKSPSPFSKKNNSATKNANNNKNNKHVSKKKVEVPVNSIGNNDKSHSPPWKVLSSKDAAKNVKREKQRRELGLSQQDQLPEDLLEDDDSATSSISTNFLSPTDKSFFNWKRFNPSTTPKGMKLMTVISGSAHSNTNANNQQPKQQSSLLPPQIGVPEIAFLGRSNVGKSSLLNKLYAFSNTATTTTTTVSKAGIVTATSAVRNDKARVGKTPGATASVNLYALVDKNDKPVLGFVDLPGFGYAKLSKSLKESIKKNAERYLSSSRKELALGILLVDIRRTPTDDDKAVLAALYDLRVPILVVATKIDKVSSDQQLQMQLQDIQQTLGLPDGQPLCVSSITGLGIKKLWQIILEACEITVQDFHDTLLLNDKNEGDQEAESEEEQEFFYDDENDELVYYSQGYDWIHDDRDDNNNDSSSVMYEYDDKDEGFDDSLSHQDYSIFAQQQQQKLLPIQSLKKKARRMERGGEV